jgi:hypothetical protein
MDQFVRRQRRVADLVRLFGASTTLIPPKVLEAVGRQFGVPDRVLDVLVPEVVLQGPRVVAIIGQLEPAGMAKHVRVASLPIDPCWVPLDEWAASSAAIEIIQFPCETPGGTFGFSKS